MTGLANFMNTSAGRALRIVLGLVLVYVGLALLGGVAGWVVAIVGLVPIALGVWGHCLLEYLTPQARHV